MWKDVFKGMLAYFPLKIWDGQIPIALAPTGNLGNGSTNGAWPIVLAGGGTIDVQVLIPNDCELEIDHWNASSTASTYPEVFGFSVNIYWGNRQVYLTQQAMPGELIFGTAQRPGRFGDRPWRVARPSGPQGTQNIGLTITNLLTTTNTIWPAMIGWRTRSAQE